MTSVGTNSYSLTVPGRRGVIESHVGSCSPKSKGFTNRPGENHCFLNGVVQVLFHLDSFREGINGVERHICLQKHGAKVSVCVVCAIKAIFSEYEFGSESHLPAMVLRNALSELYADRSRFQLSAMDDAAEAFEAVAYNIHRTLVPGAGRESRMAVCTPPCLVHSVFGTTIEERYHCPCGSTNECLRFDKIIQYVPAAGLRKAAASLKGYNSTDLLTLSYSNMTELVPFDDLLGQLVKPEPKSCDGCKETVLPTINRTGQPPQAAVFGLVWESASVPHDEVMRLLEHIQPVIDLDKIFPSPSGQPWPMMCDGVICYYGQHYVAFSYNSIKRSWIMFDDINVREVGPSWQDLMTSCRRNKYQPAVLFYQKCSGDAAREALYSYQSDVGEYFMKKALSGSHLPLHQPPQEGLADPGSQMSHINEVREISPELLAEESLVRQQLAQADADMAIAMQLQQELTLGSQSQVGQASAGPEPPTPGGAESLAIQSGVVMVKKHGLMTSSWKPKFCLLEGRNLRVYKLDKNNNPVARNDLADGPPIRVNTILVVDESNLRKSKKSEQPYRLSIREPRTNKVLFIIAPPTEEEKNMWVDCLNVIGAKVGYAIDEGQESRDSPNLSKKS
eukprot:comp21817_c0_seq1/m.31082 comp21817_c0_seq1/g.31082  ORF comp21817_c0_seq1/g.31082 comp21817_c0_seq1/m.31082 type:complete len:619 (-) comp21817_c0_seq1:111-1967(-)